jgi:hypothetical protein
VGIAETLIRRGDHNHLLMISNIIVPPSILGRLTRDHPMEPTLRRMLVDDTPPGVLFSPRDPMYAALQSFAAEHPPEGAELVEAPAGARMVRFDNRDMAGWFASFFTWFGKLKKHHFVLPDEIAREIPDDARMAIFGDWGTGMYGAPLVAKQIALAGVDAAIHLGDVYYSGTVREQQERCIALWPLAALSRTCNGNHDMYSGGHGLFDVTLASFGQPSTCFALVNANWLILGLDTAYQDADISEQQILWATRMARRYDNRAVILCSHHQAWSRFDGGAFEAGFTSAVLGRVPRVNSWFWGHEHRAVIYNRHPRYGMYGRCFGHGGFPQNRDPLLPPLLNVGNRWLAFDQVQASPGGITHDDGNAVLGPKYLAHGFAVITLAHFGIGEELFNEAGQSIWSSSRRIK